MKFFVLILSTVISFYGYGTKVFPAAAESSASVWPTMEQLKSLKSNFEA